MTAISECRFSNVATSLSFGANRVRLAAADRIKDHADVRVTAFDCEKLVEDFAFITSSGDYENKEPQWTLWVNVVRPDEKLGEWVLILGSLKGMLVDFSTKTILPFELFRSKEDDQGFYRTNITDSEGSILVDYEGGLILVEGGKIVWHIEKLWNDQLRCIVNGSIVIDGLDENGDDCTYEIDRMTGEKR